MAGRIVPPATLPRLLHDSCGPTSQLSSVLFNKLDHLYRCSNASVMLVVDLEEPTGKHTSSTNTGAVFVCVCVCVRACVRAWLVPSVLCVLCVCVCVCVCVQMLGGYDSVVILRIFTVIDHSSAV
ncbi:hypothetical protein LSH36_520g01009 [Paralvinella palmiformis]|uniref:Uncharacterized protein n=1 Tax=Paralvinella palmiformis TaxID=53620 RepID=A0AAD9J8Q2_9ANNE|nr:hypothetical protein LSH36_520g01009 [Paralvinella palmiformis]